MEKSNRILGLHSSSSSHLILQGAMARENGARVMLSGWRRAIDEMSCVEVKNCDVAWYFEVHRSSVSKITRQQTNSPKIVKIKKYITEVIQTRYASVQKLWTEELFPDPILLRDSKKHSRTTHGE